MHLTFVMWYIYAKVICQKGKKKKIMDTEGQVNFWEQWRIDNYWQDFKNFVFVCNNI